MNNAVTGRYQKSGRIGSQCRLNTCCYAAQIPRRYTGPGDESLLGAIIIIGGVVTMVVITADIVCTGTKIKYAVLMGSPVDGWQAGKVRDSFVVRHINEAK